MKSFWEERYGAAEYAYGEAPNQYFREKLASLPAGRLLLPADGEGRNSVHAAASGWQVSAFDYSRQAARKAADLAARRGVRINWQVADVAEYDFPRDHYDAVGLFFAHMPEPLREHLHRSVVATLRPGGFLILEGFAKEQLQYDSGGPRNPAMLFSLEELFAEFSGLSFLEANEETVELAEGRFHAGPAAVVRLFAQKNK